VSAPPVQQVGKAGQVASAAVPVELAASVETADQGMQAARVAAVDRPAVTAQVGARPSKDAQG
jgi:hypothetical protein